LSKQSASQAIAALSLEKRQLFDLLLKQRKLGNASLSHIPIGQENDPAPLSFPQQRLWFLEQWEPGTAAYNISAAIRLSGPLDVRALERSLGGIVRRHAALRTSLVAERGEPVQVVAEECAIALSLDNLEAVARELRAAEAERLAREEARQPFDLARGPLLRARLLRLDEREHVLVLTLHHIVCDAWSMAIFGRELAALYAGEIEHRAAELPTLPLQYPDYARWQRRWLTGSRLEQGLEYWSRQLRAAPPLLALPTDRPRPAVQGFQGATHALALPHSLTAELKLLARAERATLFMVLLAGFQALIHHYTGQTDLVVGTDVAGRERTEFEPLIGFFVNQLVLRTDLSGDPSFRNLVGRTRQVALAAYAHQEIPFDLLVQHLKPPRNSSYSPLFQAKLVLQNLPPNQVQFSGLGVTPFAFDRDVAQLDLVLNLAETGDCISGGLEYNLDLFEAGSIARMVHGFRDLLEAAVAQPDTPLSRLGSILAVAARQRQTGLRQLIREESRQRLVPGRRVAIPLTKMEDVLR